MHLFKVLTYIFILITVNLISLLADAGDRYIIKLKNNIEQTEALSNYEIHVPAFIKFIENYKKQADSPLSSKQLEIINRLKSYRIINASHEDILSINMQDIEIIEPNYVYRLTNDLRPNDPQFSMQWALQYLYAEKAWQKATGKGVVIGVVDTGIDWEHDDLVNSMWINPKEDLNRNGRFDPWPDTVMINGVYGDLNGIDDDGNGVIDDVIGYDFINQLVPSLGDWFDMDPIPYDEHGHGTYIAGVLAAERDNSKGIVGLAYNSKLMVLRCFDINGNGYADNIANAIIYGVLNGVRVFNLSFGEKYNSALMQDAINFALESGCILVASAGNEGSGDPHYPSDYEGVISVGYSNSEGRRDRFSNWGSRLDLLAPGVKILTTTPNNRYREVSGSSLSAPMVSATAALLLENNPSLTPYDISGIIISSATDAGQKQWDEFYGAGILNVNDALEFNGITNLIIKTPQNEETFNKDLVDSIRFLGSIIVPMFSKCRILLGEGNNPSEWNELSLLNYQVRDGIIHSLPIKDLRDTNYTLRLVVELKNYNTIEKRARFNISSNLTDLKILKINSLPVYRNGKRRIVLGIETNRKSVATANVIDGDNIIGSFSDLMQESEFHTVLLDLNLVPGKDYQCVVSVRNNLFTDVELRDTITIRINDDNFSIDKFVKKDYSIPISYIHNSVADFNKNGNPEIVVNDLSTGYWNSTEVYEFRENKFIKKDSLQNARLPVGLGDSNGDGIAEIFTRSVGSSVLYQAKAAGDSPFSSILFADTTSGNLYAAGMYDFTKNGRDELVVYSDTAVYILSYIGNKYQIIATAMLDGELRNIGTLPGVVFGDFDGDGKTEIAFGNQRGNLFIFEFDNNRLSLEYSNTVNYASSPQYMTTVDINGDGVLEIAVLNIGTYPLYGRMVPAIPLWSVKVLKSYAPNQYSYIFGEYFYGVRQGSTSTGIFYRNGISSGDIGLENEAIMISPFPDFYVFSLNKNTNKIEPIWHYPAAFANSAIVYDFDKNGINEFGFSTVRATDFFEYINDVDIPNTPVEFTGWSVSSQEVYLEWKSIVKENSSFPEHFNLFYGIESDGYIQILGSAQTNENNYVFDNLTAPNDYWFGVASVSSSGKISDTIFTLVHHHALVIPISAEQINESRIKINFSGRLPQSAPLNSVMNLIGDTHLLPFVINRMNDSSLVAQFSTDLPEGDYILNIKSFRDYYNAPTIDTDLNIRIEKQSEIQDELYLKKLNVLSNLLLVIEFSEPVRLDEALDIKNYSISPIGRIDRIVHFNDYILYHINLDSTSFIGALGKNYYITVSNITSLQENPMTKGAGNTLAFTFTANDLENVFVYPNPISIQRGETIYFANLTASAVVFVYDKNGKELMKLSENDGNGGVEWDGRDYSGNYLQTGIYLFKVKGTDKFGKEIESPLKKFAVIR